MKYGRFFEIGKGMLADQLCFLARALTDDKMRYFMECIRVEPDFSAVATDGRRIHIVKALHKGAQEMGIEPGAYAVKKRHPSAVWLVKVEEGSGDFPEYKRVFKETPPTFTTKWGGIKKFGASLFELCYSFPEPTAINTDYLTDIGQEEWAVSWWDAERGILFDAKDRLALIMPRTSTIPSQPSSCGIIGK